MRVKNILCIACMLLGAACSAKHDEYLRAKNIVYDPLPGENKRSEYSLPREATDNKNAPYIPLPLPKPFFIGDPPDAYNPVSRSLRGNQPHLLELGYNSLRQPSLFIHPIQKAHVTHMERIFIQHGLAADTQGTLGRIALDSIEFNVRFDYTHEFLLIDLQPLPSNTKEKSSAQADRTERANMLAFSFLDEMRTQYIQSAL